MTLPEQTCDMTVCFLEHRQACYPNRALLVLWDRARWHKGQPVIDFPSACPQLNPQEHVWERTRDLVSHNHTCPNFPTVVHAFRFHLENTLFLSIGSRVTFHLYCSRSNCFVHKKGAATRSHQLSCTVFESTSNLFFDPLWHHCRSIFFLSMASSCPKYSEVIQILDTSITFVRAACHHGNTGSICLNYWWDQGSAITSNRTRPTKSTKTPRKAAVFLSEPVSSEYSACLRHGKRLSNEKD